MQHGIKRQHLSEEAKKSKLEKDQIKIKNYKSLVDQLFQFRDDNLYNEDIFKLTTKCLLINPEFYTMWNYRREILLNLNNTEIFINYLKEDLIFLLGLLKKFPKCYWIWNHRKWCLMELVDLNKADWDFEFNTISKLLELDERNFHCWQYRRYIIANMKKDLDSTVIEEIDRREFDYTTTKIQNNFSNFSAWHQRACSIKLVKHENSYDCLKDELDLIKTGIFMSPEDTSIWLYVKYLLTDTFFIDSIKSKNDYMDILQDQLKVVEEVNELENEDTGKDNVECLKMIIFLKDLIMKQEGNDKFDKDIQNIIHKLVDLDPLRKGRYKDMLQNQVLTE
ncbi:unnamed protein product [Candida verbasci]|uniref:Geranylgeranyl transferase type-2 subunit alpha n=1 Tax=Candida verbasci TaxID=1227364 RepID=A0A9W4XKZ3_9ASCO|nr:unnamed protein product [Candida verbasci]